MKYVFMLLIFSSCVSVKKFTYNDKLRTMKFYFNNDTTGILKAKFKKENFNVYTQNFTWIKLSDGKWLIVGDSITNENYKNFDLNNAGKYNSVYYSTIPIISRDTLYLVKDMILFSKDRADKTIVSSFIFRKGNKKVDKRLTGIE